MNKYLRALYDSPNPIIHRKYIDDFNVIELQLCPYPRPKLKYKNRKGYYSITIEKIIRCFTPILGHVFSSSHTVDIPVNISTNVQNIASYIRDEFFINRSK